MSLPGCPHTWVYVPRVPPNQPKTPKRSVRVPDELWQAVREKAKRRGETVTDVVIRALKRYLRD
jgi:hypothetical protein